MKKTQTNHPQQSTGLLALAIAVTVILSMNVSAHETDQTSRVIWPDVIPIRAGMQPEGIELGNDQDFFVGAVSWSGDLTHAGAIYKGNLLTGKDQIIVRPTGKPIAGFVL